MMVRARHLSALLMAAPLVAHVAVAAAPNVQLETVDGQQQQGQWVAATPDHVQIRRNDAKAVTDVAWNDLLALTVQPALLTTRPNDDTAPAGFATCRTRDGGVLYGAIQPAADGQLSLKTSFGAELVIGFRDLASFRLAPATSSQPAEAEFQRWVERGPAGRDVLIIVRDDQVRAVEGALQRLGPDGAAFTVADRTVSVPLERIAGVVFGAGLTTQRPPLAVTLRDASRLTGWMQKADATTLTLRIAGGQNVALPLDQVATIHIISDRVVYLSDLEPTEVIVKPLMPTHWPMRRDRSVANGPLRIDGVDYAKGLGVHAYTAITYRVDRAYQAFAATIGIDDRVRPRGSVVFRVLVDGRQVYESSTITGRDAAERVRVDVQGAERVQLIVDDADGLDLGDHADWANARFIRP